MQGRDSCIFQNNNNNDNGRVMALKTKSNSYRTNGQIKTKQKKTMELQFNNIYMANICFTG